MSRPRPAHLALQWLAAFTLLLASSMATSTASADTAQPLRDTTRLATSATRAALEAALDRLDDLHQPTPRQTDDDQPYPTMDTRGLEALKTTHLHGWAEPDALAALENIMVERGEEHRARIYEALGLTETRPIRVLFLADINDYFHRRGVSPRAPDWAVGLAVPSENTIIVKFGRTPAGPWVALEPTFVHEMAHMALDRAVGASGIHIDGATEHHAHAGIAHQGARIPRWLHEGFAIAQAGEWSLERGAVLLQAGLSGKIIPLTELDRGFPAKGFGVELAYAESYHFMLRLRETHGDAALAPILAHMRDGDPFEVAYAKAIKRSFRSDERQWRDDLQVAYAWIPLVTGSSAIWTLGGLVFVLAWRRKRKEKQARLAQMALDEAQEQRAHLPPLPLPGLGLTAEHARRRITLPLSPRPPGDPSPTQLLTHKEWASSVRWPRAAHSDHPDDLDVPRTDDGHTIH